MPERLQGIVDSHCHLQHAAFAADRAAVIERAREAGIVRILVPGWDLASSEAALELAAAYPDLVHAAVGIHPHHVAEADEPAWARLEALAGETRAVAIGEIGLDFFRKLSPPDAQRAGFGRQLELARSVCKPVLVHDRDAHDTVRETLRGWAAGGGSGRRLNGVLHCFSADAEHAAALHDAGFLASFAFTVSFSSARGPRAAAAELPDEAVLLETDAPYLGPGGDRRNEPTTVLRVAAELARLRGSTPEAVANATAGAYERLLGG